jgi:hypothetical protein
MPGIKATTPVVPVSHLAGTLVPYGRFRTGENVMKRLALIFALVLTAPALAQTAPASTGPSTAMTPAPDDRAKQWVQLVDDNNYGDAYKQMGLMAQNKIAADPWRQKVSSVREPLGAMATRTIKDVKLTKTLPGMRDGQYATVRFDTSFAHKTAAVETVVLTSEKGAWSVIGYFIN